MIRDCFKNAQRGGISFNPNNKPNQRPTAQAKVYAVTLRNVNVNKLEVEEAEVISGIFLEQPLLLDKGLFLLD